MNAPDLVVRVVVSGRVQGIGYRYWTEQAASRRGLCGFVRNRRDGSVEAVLAGAAAMVEDLIETMRRGPPGARVDRLERHDGGPELLIHGSSRFVTLPTI